MKIKFAGVCKSSIDVSRPVILLNGKSRNLYQFSQLACIKAICILLNPRKHENRSRPENPSRREKPVGVKAPVGVKTGRGSSVQDGWGTSIMTRYYHNVIQ